MKRFSLIRIGVFATLALAMLNPRIVRADERDRKTVISISQPLEVPGAVLAPGTYVMKMFDSSSSRHIVQFMNERQNQQLALTFAVPAERIRPAEKTLLTMYEGSGGAPPALRTWYYPGDTVGNEFLYPHRQAVRISERTNVAVPEVETGKPAAVASTEPAQNTEPELIARAEPAPEPVPAPVAAAAATPAPEPVPEAIAEPEPQQPAAPEPQAPAAAEPQTPSPTAADKSLPQTASNGPLAALVGGLSLLLSLGTLKFRRKRTPQG